MQQTTLPANDAIKSCKAMPIWQPTPSKSGVARTGSSKQTSPFLPSVALIEHIPFADSRARSGGPEGRPIVFQIEAAGVVPESIKTAPFAPNEHISTAAPYAKPGKTCGPRAGWPAAIQFAPLAGVTQKKGRPPGGELKPEPPISYQTSTHTDCWRAQALKPTDPLPSEVVSPGFGPHAGGGSSEGRRPKQALRELVLPSPRPWHSLSIPWQSFLGFHLAVPRAEAAAQSTVQRPGSATLWTTACEMLRHGRRSLPDWQELLWEQQPAPATARAHAGRIEPSEILAFLSPGFDLPLRGNKPSAPDREPFIDEVSDTLPPSAAALGPAPIIGLPEGLPVWTGTTNSYMTRNLCSPRLREGGRAVHMLRLAPSVQVNEECEISAA